VEEAYAIKVVHLDRSLRRLDNRRPDSRAMGDGMFSYSSVLLSGAGALAGLWIGLKMSACLPAGVREPDANNLDRFAAGFDGHRFLFGPSTIVDN
jgi:hypothetical protein